MIQFNAFLIISVVFGVLRFVLPSTGQINHAHISIDMWCIVFGALGMWTFGPKCAESDFWFVQFFVLTLWGVGMLFVLPEPKGDVSSFIFKSFAHVWIGVLIQWAFLSLIDPCWFWVNKLKAGAMLMAIGLTVLEVVAFVVRKGDA